MSNKLAVILGPTASGKSALAIKLARKFNGEIVSADSRQVYKDMNIGTAKPYLGNIPYHLIDIVKPNQVFSVAQYQKLAYEAIKNIQKRGKMPFLVGGTAFYIYSVVEGWQFPKLKTNVKLRKELEAKTAQDLLKTLKTLDPQRAKTIDQKNKHRLIRAVEIAQKLGKVPEIKKQPQYDCLLLGLKPPDTALKKRIDQRVDLMIKQGLEKEIKNLVKKYGWTAVLKKTIGYAEWKKRKELSSFLQGRSLTPSTQIKQHTWQFSRRQMTWFKKDNRIHWVKNYSKAQKIAKKFLK